ncbi:Protein of unknown function [Pyronema omphalodes CBS 100304]|uniref:Uncharacterized protein n=1 Tax=Pyronema omphalodes (strain CBS 100304) TaxID=1076935 RepID=U4LLN0_PYROM|nr:Protein of unknown function [Pyronema omphalodes CBS 100304]
MKHDEQMGRWFPEQAYRFAKRLVAKIEELLKKKSKLLPGQLKYEERKADEHIALLQSERDLTQVIGKSQKEKYEVALVLDVDDGEIAIEVLYWGNISKQITLLCDKLCDIMTHETV